MTRLEKAIRKTWDFWKPRWLHLAFIWLIWVIGIESGKHDALEHKVWALVLWMLGGIVIFAYLNYAVGEKHESG